MTFFALMVASLIKKAEDRKTDNLPNADHLQHKRSSKVNIGREPKIWLLITILVVSFTTLALILPSLKPVVITEGFAPIR